MTIPYLAVANDELGDEIPHDARIVCGRCGRAHPLEWAINPKTGKETRMLACYSCGGKSYLVGVGGRLLSGERLAPSK